MSEFEEKLGSILSDPNAMSQIMSLAQALGGTAAPEPHPPADAPLTAEPPPDFSTLFSSFGEIDPQMLQTGLRLFSEFSSSDDQRTALLLALKPFLKEERRDKVDQAVRIARLSRVARVAFRLFKGRGDSYV